jgi:uncharacterized repeat protein (TIGR04138 family)
MNTTQKTTPARLRYHPRAYEFLFSALRRSQQNLGRTRGTDAGDEHNHITGRELLEGIRELALEQFGLLARTVFHCWSIHTTDDFGRMVFDRIERGEMSKTESDQLSDFSDVFDFDEALDQQYQIDVSHAFS